MDDNARPHRAGIVEEYLEDHGLERMEWPARSPDLNPIEHLWDYLGREVAALNPPPRSLHELKQGLLCVWSSLPYSGVRQLNKQHEIPNANRSSRIVTGGKVRAAKRLPRKSHTCSDGIEIRDRAGNPYRSASLSKSYSAATVR
ncbi:DDE_3 domain-containing protein [Trichonephila clavipes]|nr:DDE_3 domain-containing protein [Trichonephila clavipes]